MNRFYLVPLSLRNILFDMGVLEKCEQSIKNNGYYIPEDIFLLIKNNIGEII